MAVDTGETSVCPIVEVGVKTLKDVNRLGYTVGVPGDMIEASSYGVECFP